MRISDWSSDVCSSDLCGRREQLGVVSVFPESQHQKPRQPNVTDIVSGTFRDHQSRRTRCPPSPATSRRTRRCGTKPLQTLQFEVVNLAIRPGIIGRGPAITRRSEEHTSELQSLMRLSYAVFCLKKKIVIKKKKQKTN